MPTDPHDNDVTNKGPINCAPASSTPPPTPRAGFRSLITPIYRGSTTVFDTLAEAYQGWRPGGPYTYGIYGTPTTLQTRRPHRRTRRRPPHVHRPQRPGRHRTHLSRLLPRRLPRSRPRKRYGNSREIADDLLRRSERRSRIVRPDDRRRHRRPHPPEHASHLDRKRPARSRWKCKTSPRSSPPPPDNIPVAIDNTYAAGVLFDAFAAGVDVSMQALTKYVGGHSDLLLGTVSVRDEAAMRKSEKSTASSASPSRPTTATSPSAACKP